MHNLGSMELNASGSCLDKKLIKSCLHLPFLRESGKVSSLWLCGVVLFGVLWYFLSERRYVCSKLSALRHCGAPLTAFLAVGSLCPYTGIATGRFLPPGRGFILCLWNPEVPVPGSGARIRGLLLGSVDENWVGPLQDSSEEVLCYWWAGWRIGDCTVLLSVRQCFSAWCLSTNTFHFFPQYVFLAGYIRTFKPY